MARMPGTTWLGEHAPVQSNGQRLRMSRYDVVCVHTIVGYAPAHAAHFSVEADGTILQSRDTLYRSGANLDGNHRIIAIENEDHGSAFGAWNVNNGHAVPSLTAAQVEANAKILAWAHKTHGVPLQLCPNSKSTSRGLAYHRQGIDGNFADYDYPGRVSGGEVWTTSRGKVCPGDRRISQRPAILARAKKIVAGGTPTPTEPEDDMPYTEAQLTQFMKNAIDAMADDLTQNSADGVARALDGKQVPAQLRKVLLTDTVVRRGTNPDGTPNLVPLVQEIADTKTGVIASAAELAGLRSAVAALATGQGIDPARIQEAVEDGVAAALARVEVVVNAEDEDA